MSSGEGSYEMSRRPEWPQHGKHRRGGHAVTPRPAPQAPRPRPTIAPPPTAAEETTTELVLGVPLTGLRKFDLGTIPASVTPPSTWRSAAWFAVAASVAVVVGLAFAAFALVGKPNDWKTIDALPGEPTKSLVIVPLPGDSATEDPDSSSRTTTSTSPDRSTSTSADGGTQSGPGVTPTPTSGPPPSTGTSTTRPTTSPTRTTVGTYLQVADPMKMGDRTELYFAKVTDDPAGAYALTTGQMRSEGKESIEQRYSDVSDVQVKEMTIDPQSSTTTSTIEVTRKDGTKTTEHRELSFSPGSDPKIADEAPAV